MTHAFAPSSPLGDRSPGADGPVALPPAKAGMIAFLLTEASFFGTLIMAYVYFLSQTLAGNPKPIEVFYLPSVIAASACLFSSSATVHLAEKALRRGRQSAFLLLWGLTIVLGALFLLGTMWEWSDLIGKWGLTISRNLFGSSYFTLVGFHALHVTIGVVVMSIIFGLGLKGQITVSNQTTVEVVSWYWHFVDAVWLLVFILVYLAGR
jgi:cytochrome c oxidase subunit 3/cytochrome o ubiquinol oxidase subunit 3